MSGFKERVDQRLVLEAQNAARAQRAVEEKVRQKALDEANVAKRRLELAQHIMEKWDKIGVAQMLREINSDIWNTYGKYSEQEYSDEGVTTQRTHELTATHRYINEKWQDVKEWRFGRHKEWISRGRSWDTGESLGYYNDKIGPYKITIASELVGFDVKTSESQLGVSLWTGGANSDNGWIDIYDTDYRLNLPEFNFRVSHGEKQRGTKLQLRFNQSEFNIGNASTLIDSVFFASSVERARHFVPRMREQEAELRSVRNRIGERRSA